MAKRGKQVTQAITTKSKAKVKGNLFNINGHTIMDLFNAICSNPEDEHASDIILNTLVAIYAIFIMAQLRISTTESNAFVDQLPSYKEYKRKVINGLPGRTLAALSAVFSSLSFIIADTGPKAKVEITSEDLTLMVSNYSHTPIPNSKRITSPNIGNWSQFLMGELSSTLGTILSCPSSNIKIFNLDADKVKQVSKPSEILSLLGVSTDFLEKYGITEADSKSVIFEKLKIIMHQTSGGIPVGTLEFTEAGTVTSTLESFVEIVRHSSESPVPGQASSINEGIISRLAPWEKSGYEAALKAGNKNLIKRLETQFGLKYKTDEA